MSETIPLRILYFQIKNIFVQIFKITFQPQKAGFVVASFAFSGDSIVSVFFFEDKEYFVNLHVS